MFFPNEHRFRSLLPYNGELQNANMLRRMLIWDQRKNEPEDNFKISADALYGMTVGEASRIEDEHASSFASHQCPCADVGCDSPLPDDLKFTCLRSNRRADYSQHVTVNILDAAQCTTHEYATHDDVKEDIRQFRHETPFLARSDRPEVTVLGRLVFVDGVSLDVSQPDGWDRIPRQEEARMFRLSDGRSAFHWRHTDVIQLFDANWKATGSMTVPCFEWKTSNGESYTSKPEVQNVLLWRGSLVLITNDHHYIHADDTWIRLPDLCIRDSQSVDNLYLYVIYHISRSEQGLAMLDPETKRWAHVYTLPEKLDGVVDCSLSVAPLQKFQRDG